MEKNKGHGEEYETVDDNRDHEEAYRKYLELIGIMDDIIWSQKTDDIRYDRYISLLPIPVII